MDSLRTDRRSGRWKWFIPVLSFLAVAIAVGAATAHRLRAINPVKPPQRLDLLYAAWNEFNSSRFDQASAILDRRAAIAMPTALDWMLRARIAESRGRLTDALDHLKQIPDADPIGSQAWLKAGQIELARHNARGAETAFVHSLKLNPDQIQAYRELAYLYALQRRRHECDAQFRAMSARFPFDYVLAFAWCQNYCRLWDYNEARPVLSQFVEFDPADRLSRLALATSLRLASLFDQAEDAVRSLPDSDPDARALRVESAIDKGEIEAATALASNGPADHARLNALRGRLALGSKDATGAAGYFRAALRQEPDDPESSRGLGLALQLMGEPRAEEFIETAARYEKFRRALQNSTTTVHTDPKLYTKLGEHCESNGCASEARVWYELALRRDPEDVKARESLDRLGQSIATEAAAPVLNQTKRPG
jgi:tetratricopeptide (TPR) repeat protein